MIAPIVHWVGLPGPRMLAFGARPRAGEWLEEEIAGYGLLGFRHLVSLLETHEVAELGLQSEAALCLARGIGFHELPIADRGVPADRSRAHALFTELTHRIRSAEPVYIHCRAGIGRSSLVAAGVLTHLGIGATQALSLLRKARGLAVPDTDAQRQWIEVYAARLERSGEG